MVNSGNINLSPGQGTKSVFRQWKIRENHIIMSKPKLVQKLCDDNISKNRQQRETLSNGVHFFLNCYTNRVNQRPIVLIIIIGEFPAQMASNAENVSI